MANTNRSAEIMYVLNKTEKHAAIPSARNSVHASVNLPTGFSPNDTRYSKASRDSIKILFILRDDRDQSLPDEYSAMDTVSEATYQRVRENRHVFIRHMHIKIIVLHKNTY